MTVLGLLGRPAAATRDGLDASLCAEMPQCVAIFAEPPSGPDTLPQFGAVLRDRYRLEATLDGVRVYRLAPR